MDKPKTTTLQIAQPIGATLLLAVVIIIASVILVEFNYRSKLLLPPNGLASSLGITNNVLDVKLSELRRNVAQRGSVDVIFLGSSQTNNGIDTEKFESEYLKITGDTVLAFNMGSQAFGVGDAEWLVGYLKREYQPKLIVYGTTVRDFSVDRQLGSFSDNPWIQYQQGFISPDGWLRDNLQVYQRILVTRNWMKSDFHEQTIIRETIQKRMQPLGFMPNRLANPDLVSQPPSPNNPDDLLIFEEYASSALSKRRIQYLRNVLAYQSERLGIVIFEAPVHPTFIDYYPNGWQDQNKFIDEIGSVVQDLGAPFLPTTQVLEISPDGWFNRNHLSLKGARAFTTWLASEMANSDYVVSRLACADECAPAEPSAFRPFSQGLPPTVDPLFETVDINESLLRFAAFVLIVLLIYYALPHKTQNYWLLVSSYAFYYTWAWEFTLTLLTVTIFNFLIAQRIPVGRKESKKLLHLGIVINLLVLAFFKYNGFFVPQLFQLFGGIVNELPLSALRILLPVGLSYITLNMISYLLDVSQGLLSPSRNFSNFALYLAYFPKLLSGPIERARHFLPLLAEKRLVDNHTITSSITLVVVGITRKFIIADTLFALIPSAVFDSPFNYTSPELFMSLVGYGFFIYNDFAGYTNIVRGVSGLFGIELSYNFRQPMFSQNLAEFWNRWHRTLSNWLRDYIFLPLNRSLLRKYKSPKHWLVVSLPPIVTMLVSGLWHGATLNLLLWGFMNGALQAFERFRQLRRTGPVSTKPPTRWRRIASPILVITVVLVTVVPFLLPIRPAYYFLRAMTTWRGWALPAASLTYFLLASLLIDWFQARKSDEMVFLHWPLLLRSTLLATVAIVLFLVTRADVGAPFVYQGF